ncbi:MAG: pentapeptide repeat-containing protein [Gammaproteobacteria bacterium]|nr:pentapeptide repeat-containing protein [Gammaproteobacteria bacterium]
MQKLGSTDEFSGQVFKRLDFAGEKLASRKFYDCTFVACNFNEATFDGCKFNDCRIDECNLSLVKFDGTSFFDTEFEDCKLIGIDWTRAAWPQIKLSSPVNFSNSNLSDSTFFGLFLGQMRMTGCKAHAVDFSETDCRHADFSHTELFRSVFHHADLSGADFSYAEAYAIDVFNNRIEGAKFSLPEAVSLLESLGIDLVVTDE